MSNRLQVNIEHNGSIISAYLTDEGLVVDVFEMVDDESEVVASGYELFSEVGLKPPENIDDLADADLFECDCCGDTFDNDFSMRVGAELYCEGCWQEQDRRDKKNGLFGGELDISN